MWDALCPCADGPPRRRPYSLTARGRLQAQLNGRELGWAPLNRLCWAIGSISGSMVEEQENRCGWAGPCGLGRAGARRRQPCVAGGQSRESHTGTEGLPRHTARQDEEYAPAWHPPAALGVPCAAARRQPPAPPSPPPPTPPHPCNAADCRVQANEGACVQQGAWQGAGHGGWCYACCVAADVPDPLPDLFQQSAPCTAPLLATLPRAPAALHRAALAFTPCLANFQLPLLMPGRPWRLRPARLCGTCSSLTARSLECPSSGQVGQRGRPELAHAPCAAVRSLQPLPLAPGGCHAWADCPWPRIVAHCCACCAELATLVTSRFPNLAKGNKGPVTS